MRRKSHEMPSDWAMQVLDKAPYITLSLNDVEGYPYAVPLSMARVGDNTFYFHCAPEGKKLDLLLNNPKVCLTAVTKCRPVVDPNNDNFTLEFQSATAFGTAMVVTEKEEQILGLRAVCQRFLPHHMDAFDSAIERSLHRTSVVKVVLSEPPTGKRKQYDSHGQELTYGRME